VLLALGLDEDTTHYAIRIGIGRFNTIDEIEFVTDKISNTINHINKI
jgi:cysteine desulfurase